ncbi:hypothetical protein LINGRAPRIM_LOCUS2978 [Linum grandiflorum]
MEPAFEIRDRALRGPPFHGPYPVLLQQQVPPEGDRQGQIHLRGFRREGREARRLDLHLVHSRVCGRWNRSVPPRANEDVCSVQHRH